MAIVKTEKTEEAKDGDDESEIVLSDEDIPFGPLGIFPELYSELQAQVGACVPLSLDKRFFLLPGMNHYPPLLGNGVSSAAVVGIRTKYMLDNIRISCTLLSCHPEEKACTEFVPVYKVSLRDDCGLA